MTEQNRPPPPPLVVVNGRFCKLRSQSCFAMFFWICENFHNPVLGHLVTFFFARDGWFQWWFGLIFNIFFGHLLWLTQEASVSRKLRKLQEISKKWTKPERNLKIDGCQNTSWHLWYFIYFWVDSARVLVNFWAPVLIIWRSWMMCYSSS